MTVAVWRAVAGKTSGFKRGVAIVDKMGVL